jgi:hypothetical protein
MNDHLIKNLWISLLWSLLGSIIIISLALFFINTLRPIEWYKWIFVFAYPGYLMLKSKNIILSIDIIENEVQLKSFSILGGKKDLNLKLDEIIKLDFYRGLKIQYKTDYGKTTETFLLNAEPWNSLYGQIKALKLATQDLKQNKNTRTIDS